MNSHLHSRCIASILSSFAKIDRMLLSDLPNGQHALVLGVIAGSSDVGVSTLRRLGELGFIAGEPVQMLRRGPGGREPLAVQIGETLFALRLLEAQCIEVQDITPPTNVASASAPSV
jgi:ferrous iron transport protein A